MADRCQDDCVHLQEEFRVAAHDGLDQRITIGRLLGNRLAKCKRVTASIRISEVKVVSGNGCWSC
jgi:hypothetical protein